MKINPVSSFNYNSNNINFKRTAVPYPEYENAYENHQSEFERQVTNVIHKISALFSPSVDKESKNIKSSINNIYTDSSEKNPKAQLLSVLA